MEHAKRIGKKLLYPPRWVLLCLAPLSFAAVLLVLVSQNTRGALYTNRKEGDPLEPLGE